MNDVVASAPLEGEDVESLPLKRKPDPLKGSDSILRLQEFTSKNLRLGGLSIIGIQSIDDLLQSNIADRVSKGVAGGNFGQKSLARVAEIVKSQGLEFNLPEKRQTNASSSSYTKIIGNVIATLRHDKGLSQDQLAEQSGISQPTISRIEKGSVGITVTQIDAIVSALGTTAKNVFDSADAVRTSLKKSDSVSQESGHGLSLSILDGNAPVAKRADQLGLIKPISHAESIKTNPAKRSR